MADTLEVKKRETRGKRNARRDRATGTTPAVLYGHGAENVSLSVDSAALAASVQHGSPLVELAGDLKESALIRDIQWDPMGNQILHIDFARVKADERIQVSIGFELRGIAPGTKDGGILNQVIHDILVECPAMSIPEKIEVNINHLGIGESILTEQIELPDQVALLCTPGTVVVQCNEPAPEVDEDEMAAGMSVEPEVIGRKPAEEEGGAEES